MTALAAETAPPAAAEVDAAVDPLDLAINLTVNHPAKMLTLLTLATQPTEFFGPNDLRHAINDAQGEDIGWQRDQGGGLREYCQSSLLPAGFVEEGEILGDLGTMVPAWRITEHGRLLAVPLFGALLDLELHAEFSSQVTFGSVNSLSDMRDAIRGPLIRLRILEQVYDAEASPVNLTQLRAAIPRNKGAVDWAFEDLVAAGILEARYKTNPAHRTLRLTAGDDSRTERYRTRIRPEGHAIRQTAARLFAAGARQVHGDELVREILRDHPDADPATIWRFVTDFTPPCLEFADAELFGGNAGKRAPRMRIQFSEAHARPTRTLVESIRAVRTSPEYRALASVQAMRIIRDKSAVAYLMAKARANSIFTEDYRTAEAKERTDRLRGRVALRPNLSLVARPVNGELPLTPDTWPDNAACRDMASAEQFFGWNDTLSAEEADRARVICERCVACLRCLRQAFVQGEEYGMWGGLSENERRSLPVPLRLLMRRE